MTIALRSSGAGFGKIASKLEALADKGEERMAERGAEAAQKRLDTQFATETGPDGSKWQDKQRSNGKPILVEKGDLSGSASAKASGGGIDLTVSDPKAGWHQDGTPRMAARKMLPERSLEGAWESDIDEAAHKAIHEVWDEG